MQGNQNRSCGSLMRSNCCCDSHSTTRRVRCKKGWISSAARSRAWSPPLLLLLLLWDVEGRGHDVIILESMQICRPHKNRRAAFLDFSTLRLVFKKVRFQDPWGRSVQNDAIHVCFRKRALSCGRPLTLPLLLLNKLCSNYIRSLKPSVYYLLEVKHSDRPRCQWISACWKYMFDH